MLLQSLGVLVYREKRIGEEIGNDQIDAVIAAARAATAADAKYSALASDTAAVLTFLDTALLPAVYRIIEALAIDSSAPLEQSSSGHDTRSLVSIKNLIVVNCAVELLFYWGVATYASSKLGFDLAEKQFPSKMLLSKDHVLGVHKRLQRGSTTMQIHAYINCLRACATHTSFKTSMLQRNMKRIILVFLALSTHQASEDAAIALQAKAVLDEMKGCSSTQHLVVGELRWASRCPEDIKSASLRMFSDILVSSGGLHNVILAYIQNVDSDDPSSLKIALHVAMLVVSVPSHLTKAQYFSVIAPQVAGVYSLAHGRNDISLMRVCAMIVIRMAKVAPALADALVLAHWTKHLSILHLPHAGVDGEGSADTLVDEQTLSTSIGVLGSLLTLCPVSPTIIGCFKRCSIGRLLIALLLEMQQKCRSSYVLRPLQDLCTTYLSHASHADAAADISAALLLEVACDVCSAADGGVELRSRVGDGSTSGMRRLRLGKLSSATRLDSSGISLSDITRGLGLAGEEGVVPGSDLSEVVSTLATASIADGGEGAQRMLRLAEKSSAAMELLLAVDRREGADHENSVSAALFLLSMRQFLGTGDAQYGAAHVGEHGSADTKAAASLVVMTMLSFVPMDIILKKCDVVLQLLSAYLEAYGSEVIDTRAEDDDGDETLEAILNILESILVLGNAERSAEEEVALRQLLPSLQALSVSHPSPTVSLAAANAALLLITRASDRQHEQKAVLAALSGQCGQRRTLRLELDAWRKDGLVDSPSPAMRGLAGLGESTSPAMRGLAVRNLISYLHDCRHTTLHEDDARLALQTALAFLADDESFVFLHALKAISVLASQDKAGVTAVLLSLFAAEAGHSGADDITRELGVCLLDMRRRALMGDALSLVVRRHRETIGPLLPSIVAGCIKMLRAVPVPSAEEAARLDEAFDLRTLRTVKEKNDKSRGNNDEKNGGNGDEERGGCGIDQTDPLVEAVLLRQSAMTLLADAVTASGWGASKYLLDVVDIATHVVSVERLRRGGTNDSMRRSAAFLLRQVVSGLQQRLLYVHDAGFYLKKIYATLKVIANDSDKVVKFQAEEALAQLKDMVVNELKPPLSPI